MKYRFLIFVFSFFAFSCSLFKKVEKINSSDYKYSDTSFVKKSIIENKNEKDSSTKEVKTSSSKSSFSFVLKDSTPNKTVINNYIPTGNQQLDFMKYLASSGMLKSGSIDLQHDSSKELIGRLITSNKELELKYDSLSSSNQSAFILRSKKERADTIRILIFAFVTTLVIALILFLSKTFKVIKL